MPKPAVAFSLLCACLCLATAGAEVHFSPSTGVYLAIKQEIENAKQEIVVAMYTFTNRKLAQALLEAGKRGVLIRVLLDEEAAGEISYSKHGFLRAGGIAVRLYAGTPPLYDQDWPGKMHHKFAVVDGVTVLTGSVNWTASGVHKNNENLLIIRDSALAKAYTAEFEKLWQACAPRQ